MATQTTDYFTAERSVETVTARNAGAGDERLREIMEVVTRKLHEAARELEPTPEEWLAAIRFLTETGQACSDSRQEFILLSDVLGVSMLVDALNDRRPAAATESTVLGPFHLEGAPARAAGEDICLDGKGEPLLVEGRVLDTAGASVASATLDVWQANEEGFYDVQQPGLQPAFNLRGLFTTDAEGRFRFRTVKPRCYAIPDDGPVGRLLKALGRHPWRPAHLHFIVSAPGFETLTTHLFDPEDPYIASDAVFGVKQGLLGDFRRVEGVDESGGEIAWRLAYDFVLAPDPSTESAA